MPEYSICTRQVSRPAPADIQQLIRTLRCSRRFCSAPRGHVFWENEVTFNWKILEERFADREEKQYLQHCILSVIKRHVLVSC